MTDDLRKAVVQPAADGARDTRGRRLMALLAAIAAVSAVAFAGIATDVFLREVDLQQQVQALNTSDQQNHAAAQTLADQVRKLGGTPVVSPPPGPTGAQGPAGRGITGTAIIGGHFFVNYTDNVSEDKGQIVGKDGAAGPTGVPGQPGRGITGSVITGGHLLISYTDNTTTDAGQVVGKDGRGVVSMETTASGHLLVSYTDGTTADVGPLPPGPPGPKGDKGDQGQPGMDGKDPASWTWTDVLGRKYTCTRDAGSPDSAPTYTCAAATPTTTTPAARTRTSGR